MTSNCRVGLPPMRYITRTRQRRDQLTLLRADDVIEQAIVLRSFVRVLVQSCGEDVDLIADLRLAPFLKIHTAPPTAASECTTRCKNAA